MKLILIASLFTFSYNVWAAKLTHKLQATQIKYNEVSKLYDVSFMIRAGIYQADEKQIKCLQKSLDNKVEAYIEYEAVGLKITNCN